MGMCNIPYIFQEKISELFDGFDRLCAYVVGVLVITKDNFADNMKALEKFLQKPTEAGFKIKTEI